MNKYLIEILKIQSSVILPTFGSLMITNPKTGKIVFNPHLKFNDGALAKYIAEKEGTDQQAAQNQIAKFIREIDAELGKGNSYDMFEFGSFVKDNDGNVDFKMDPKGAVASTTDQKTQKASPKKEKSKPKKEEKASKKLKEEKAPPKTKDTKVKKEVSENESKPTIAVQDKPEDKTTLDKLSAKLNPSVKKEIEKDKQDKNKFIPAEEKPKSVDKTIVNKKETKSTEKKSAIELATGDAKIAAELKKPEIKTGTKKDTAQDKNSFTPADDKKAVATSAAALTALSAAKQKEGIKNTVDKVKEEASKAATSTQSIKDKHKKSATSDKKQKVNPEQKKEKKKKSKLGLIILLLLLIGGGTAAYFYKDQIMTLINGAEETVTEEEETNDHNEEVNNVNPEDEIIDDENVEDEITEDESTENEIIEDESVEAVVDHSTGGNYHVIGNAFSESANADLYVSAMKSKGYGSAKTIGRFDQLYLVSIQQFDSRSAAATAASSAGEGAWVFKH